MDSKIDLKPILENHLKCLRSEPGGCRANLRDANLKNCEEADLALAMSSHLPSDGAFVGWKKRREGVLVKLLIPSNAKRSHGAGRKCRAEFAQVLKVEGADVAVSIYDKNVTYKRGKIVRPINGWCEDRWEECAPGIHFWITKEEAIAWQP